MNLFAKATADEFTLLLCAQDATQHVYSITACSMDQTAAICDVSLLYRPRPISNRSPYIRVLFYEISVFCNTKLRIFLSHSNSATQNNED